MRNGNQKLTCVCVNTEHWREREKRLTTVYMNKLNSGAAGDDVKKSERENK